MLGRSIFYKTFAILIIVWVAFFLQENLIIDTQKWVAAKENGWWSVLSGTFLHGSYGHIIGNTKGLLIGLPILFYLHKKYANWLIIIGIIVPTSVCVMLDMRLLGISGLVFCVLSFLIFSGIGSKDKTRFYISLVLTLIYAGSFLAGITPEAGYGIAWQAHLTGATIGALTALYRYLN